jgi:hypothetical protein
MQDPDVTEPERDIHFFKTVELDCPPQISPASDFTVSSVRSHLPCLLVSRLEFSSEEVSRSFVVLNVDGLCLVPWGVIMRVTTAPRTGCLSGFIVMNDLPLT